MNNKIRSVVLGLAILAMWAATAWSVPVTTSYGSWTVFGYTTSGVYDATDTYVIGGQGWAANLVPLQATYRRAVSQNFFDVLTAAFPGSAGWSYASAVNELSDNSLVIHTYDVQGTAARVGAEFHVEYVPHGTDPTANLHWIQVVTDNHNVTGLIQGHGTLENIVDNPFSPGGRSPYYDDGGAANGSHFYDFPGRTDANQIHYWNAELFLVSGPAAGAGAGLITFYGGVTWGWENHPVPEPATVLLLVSLLGAASGVLRRRR